jgi:hypothetical protein
MCQLFVERDEVPDIDVTIVLFEEDVLADLVSGSVLAAATELHGENRPVNEGILETELQNELL